MVSKKDIERQLKRVHFNHLAWGRSECQELPNIILPDETILECVNGMYEGGFALLVATDMRVLLIDKKPLNYLTVEDLRFDMISEIDYSHRLLGARISISTGSKNLKFTSYNQQRLRKLIGHVQHHMADLKKVQNNHQEDQKQHLEQINQQLQAYLIAQHQQQEALRQQLEKQTNVAPMVLPEPIKPSPELSDFLLAQRLLLEQAPPEAIQAVQQATVPVLQPIQHATQPQPSPRELHEASNSSQLADLYAEGMQEIFGRRSTDNVSPPAAASPQPAASPQQTSHGLEINPMKIAYSKLPMALRNRKFGRPSFHAHSQQATTPLATQPNPQI